jgi:acyltransferase
MSFKGNGWKNAGQFRNQESRVYRCRENKGHFSFHVYDAVVVLFSSHGHLFWFALTAVAGSLMILSLARATRAPRWMNYLGSNTLILFCLNGVFYHFVNDPLARIVAGYCSSGTILTAIGLFVTAVSILLAAAFIPLFHSWLPWLVGKGKSKARGAEKTPVVQKS